MKALATSILVYRKIAKTLNESLTKKNVLKRDSLFWHCLVILFKAQERLSSAGRDFFIIEINKNEIFQH